MPKQAQGTTDNFDYFKTVEKVERMLSMIEDPETGVSQAQKLIDKANACLDKCYDHLRSERGKL